MCVMINYRAAKFFHEFAELRFELGADADESEFSLLLGGGGGGEEALNERVLALLHQPLEGRVQRVVVLLDELRRVVADGASKVTHQETLVVAHLAVIPEGNLHKFHFNVNYNSHLSNALRQSKRMNCF